MTGEQDPAVPAARWSLRAVVLGGLAAVLASSALVWSLVPEPAPAERRVAAVGTSPSGSTGAPEGTRPASSTSPPPTTRPTTTTTTAPPVPSSITLAFSGDLLTHMPLTRHAAEYGAAVGKPYDFVPMLSPMTPVVSPADLALCHLEVPVAPTPGRIAGYPVFGAPAELVDAVAAAGYDGCSTSSNHSLDQGLDGIATTLGRFDQVGLGHAGMARNGIEGAGARHYDVEGVRVAHLSYAYGFNGYQIPAEAPWAVDQIDPARIRSEAATARAAGADLVVVSLHWGTEYVHEPSAYQRDIAGQILPSPDIDLVIGHHAHVVQPIEQVAGTFVVFGLGNQLANQTQLPRRDGLTAVATATRGPDGRWAVAGVEAVPTYVDLPSHRVLPVVPTLADPATPPALRAELAASYDRTAAVLAGPATPGVTLAPKPG